MSYQTDSFYVYWTIIAYLILSLVVTTVHTDFQLHI